MIPVKYARNENPDWRHDVLVAVTLFGKTIVFNGYRPYYKVKHHYLETTPHWFIEGGEAKSNVSTLAFVKFITPEAYPHCLSIGIEIEVGEGSVVVGFARCLGISNGWDFNQHKIDNSKIDIKVLSEFVSRYTVYDENAWHLLALKMKNFEFHSILTDKMVPNQKLQKYSGKKRLNF